MGSMTTLSAVEAYQEDEVRTQGQHGWRVHGRLPRGDPEISSLQKLAARPLCASVLSPVKHG